VIVHVLTLFPEIFQSTFTHSIIGRAIRQNKVKINIINIRDFASGNYKQVDDKPYGGGAGMVLKVDIIVKALESINPKPYTILLSASGEKYKQQDAQNLSGKKSIALICGHYEGIDARVEKFVDKICSIGDFVLTGGEIAAMAIINSTLRLIPQVISNKSSKDESFSVKSQLEYPQYTRPENFRNLKVPKVLLTGNHEKITNWRKQQAQKRTRKFRPDLG